MEITILDEADEMLNMGFYKDVRHIIELMKARKSLSMFSATISREVMDIGWLYQRDAEEITVQPVEDSAPRIDQYLVLTTGRNKLADMAEIIVQKGYKRVMVFCNQKYTTAMLANQMARLNFVVDCLHGDLSQAERNKIMGEFKAGNIAVLVATDVAARGIEPDQFCLNESCHNMTRDDLIQATADLERNPHVAQHGENQCSDCHKAHRASVNACSQCHNDAPIPEGWISAADNTALEKVAGQPEQGHSGQGD